MQRRAMLARVTAAGFAVSLVVSAAACAGDEEDAPPTAKIEECVTDPNNCLSGPAQDGGTVTWIISQPGTGWNLIGPAGGSVYSLQAMAGVLPNTGYSGPDGEYVFDLDVLAEEPQLLSTEPFSYQFVLSDQAVWDDGTPITGDDILVTWYMSTGPDKGHCTDRDEETGCNPRSTTGADQIETIDVSEDGKTVTVTLLEGENQAEWFSFMGVGSVTSGIWPSHLAEPQGIDWQDPDQLGEYFQFLNGVPAFSGGPLRIVEGDLETRIVKERNPNWYGEPAPAETIIQEVLVDAGGYVEAFGNGEVDGGSPPDLDPDVIDQLLQRDDVRVHIHDGPSWEHVDFNLDNPQLQDVELRRAIFTAIDREDIAERNFGRLYPEYRLRNNYSSFLEDSPFYQDHITGTGFGTGDLAQARSILQAAGYTGFDEGEGPLTLDGEQIGPFRLRSTETAPRATSLNLIQQQLGQVGIETNIEFTDTLGATLVGQDYDIMQFGWSGSPSFFVANSSQYGICDGANNFGNYCNEDYDVLALQALGAPTLEEAADYTNQAYEIMVPEAYILPLYVSPVYFFARDTLVNVRDNGKDSRRGMYNIGEWGLRAEE